MTKPMYVLFLGYEPDCQNYAATRNMDYLETSSKDDFQVEKAFEVLAAKILQS